MLRDLWGRLVAWKLVSYQDESALCQFVQLLESSQTDTHRLQNFYTHARWHMREKWSVTALGKEMSSNPFLERSLNCLGNTTSHWLIVHCMPIYPYSMYSFTKIPTIAYFFSNFRLLALCWILEFSKDFCFLSKCCENTTCSSLVLTDQYCLISPDTCL